MLPLSACNSGLTYPDTVVIVLLFARVIVSESADGVNVADDVAPVITFVPSNTLWSPVVLYHL